jgi:protein-S-isoprenylcysteine O-methyltransferase Ste14
MNRAIFLTFSLLAYAFFLATFVVLIGFVSASSLSPVSIDGVRTVGVVPAILCNLALISLFGLQHSLMARPAFKRWWTRVVPLPLERSVFVICASAVLWILFLLWKPLPLVVWSTTNPLLVTAMWAISGGGWLLVLASTFLIDHFELFGVQQALAFARSRPPRDPQFVTPFLYRMVRHPLYLGFLLAFWAAPRMSLGHLLFAAVMTAYVFIAIIYEERDLVTAFGDSYRQYQAKVGKLIPGLKN